MSKNGCGWECCPSGIIEHIKHYRYLREFTDITFAEYWWHEFKSLIGFNRVSDLELEDPEATDE